MKLACDSVTCGARHQEGERETLFFSAADHPCPPPPPPPPTQTAIYGNFSAPKAQEIVAARGDVLELLRPDDAGRLVVAASTPAYGQLRSLAPFRLTGAPRDYIVVGSDSGRVVILEVVADGGGAPSFKKVHQETFGKSGVRRSVPGQYAAADPKGRALMVAAIEKSKFVYTLNRDAASALTISSPLDAHKSRVLTLALTGLDAGYDNPVFAALEIDYTECDEDHTGEAAEAAVTTLTLYELDLGLNHVVRKSATPIDATASRLVPVPGGGDGPGGVLICCDGWIVYRGPEGDAESELRAPVPRREGLPPDRGTLIVATATHKQRSTFFALLQTEYGDIFKATLSVGEAGNGVAAGGAASPVSALRLSYFDTLPPAASLCVLKTGFLFAASEFGNHGLYQFAALGDGASVESVATRGARPAAAAPTFEPTPLTNLVAIDELDSLAPMIDGRVANLLREEVPQLYAACGRGPRSTLRLLRPGAAVTDMAASPLPGAPTGVWTLRKGADSPHDAYIVASFANATLVLAVGETVEEVADSGLAGGVATLAAQTLADGSLLQVHAGGLRHIRPDGRVAEWRSPGRRAVARAATNARQCALALAGGELIAFELDPATGALAQASTRDLGADVAALDLAPVPPGRARARFLAVAGYDATIRVVGLDPTDGMKVLALQAAPAVADHLAILEEGGGGLFLHAGLANGVLLRAELDGVTGHLSDARSRFLGTRAPRLVRVRVRDTPALLALSSRPWLAHASDGARHALVPLATDALDFAAPFASDAVPEGVVAAAGGTLRVLALDRVADGGFNAATTRLRYTPRRMVVHEDGGAVIVGEADHGVAETGAAPMDADASAAAPTGVEFDEDAAAERERVGAPRAPDGTWAACVRIVDARTLATRALAPLGAACVTSMTLVTFDGAPDEGALLAVGTAAGLRFHPRACEGGAITLFRAGPGATTLELLHTTPVDAIPGALVPFKGRLLAGVGASLRLLDLGRKKLLRKADLRGLPSHVVSLAPVGARVFIGDQAGSALLARYSAAEGAFHVAADDAVPRHVTAALALDYDSVALGDKFGNVCVLRLDAAASAAVEADPTGGRAAAAPVGGSATPAPHQLTTEACVHVGDAVTWLARAALQPGAPDALLYGTLGGRIGALTPLTTRADADFAASLEMHMRLEAPPLAGRDHLAYRSAYYPTRHVADGDLCEAYGGLAPEARARVAGELESVGGGGRQKVGGRARARAVKSGGRGEGAVCVCERERDDAGSFLLLCVCVARPFSCSVSLLKRAPEKPRAGRRRRRLLRHRRQRRMHRVQRGLCVAGTRVGGVGRGLGRPGARQGRVAVAARGVQGGHRHRARVHTLGQTGDEVHGNGLDAHRVRLGGVQRSESGPSARFRLGCSRLGH